MPNPAPVTGGRVGSRSPWRWTSLVALAAVVVSAVVGAVLTGQSVTDGDVMATLLRFSLAIIFGAYFLVLHRTAKQQRPSPPPSRYRPRG